MSIAKEPKLKASDYSSLECEFCIKMKKVTWVSTEFDLKEHIEKFHNEDFKKYREKYPQKRV